MTLLDPSNQDQSNAGLRTRRPISTLFRKILIVFGVLIALYLVGVLLMKALKVEQLHQAQQILRVFGEWWMIVRVVFITTLMIYWKEINTWIARRKKWTDAHLERVLAGRWVTLCVLCFVELFLVQRIHEPLTDRWFH